MGKHAALNECFSLELYYYCCCMSLVKIVILLACVSTSSTTVGLELHYPYIIKHSSCLVNKAICEILESLFPYKNFTPL